MARFVTIVLFGAVLWNSPTFAVTNVWLNNASSGGLQVNFYPPSGPPVIGTYKNMSDYRILENVIRRLVCHIGSSIPPTLLTWDCYNTEGYTSKSNYSQSEVSFSVRRDRDAGCTCWSKYNGSSGTVNSSATIKFVVLYPPEKVQATISADQNFYNDVTDNFSITENTNITVNCSAINGYPPPEKYNWIGIYVAFSNWLSFRASRYQRGNISCLSSNEMIETDRSDIIVGKHLLTFFMEVLYPPNLNVSDVVISVIEGYSVSIKCNSVGGSTTTQTVSWNTDSPSGSVSSTLTIHNVSRNHAGNYTCCVNYTLTPTYGVSLRKCLQGDTSVNVLYPPEHLVTHLTWNDQIEFKASNIFSIAEGSYVKLVCSSGGNPAPTLSWSGKSSSGSDVLAVLATRDVSGTYLCNAKNVMKLTSGSIVYGESNRSFEINVLYPPKAIELQQVEIREGEDFYKTCLTDSGHVNNLTVYWQKGNETVGSHKLLVVKNSKSSDAGFYRCIVHYSMNPTYGEDVSMTLQTVLFLKVKADISVELPLPEPPKELPTAAAVAVGVVAGASFGVLITVVATSCMRKWKLKKSEKPVEAEKPLEASVYYQNLPPKQGSDTDAARGFTNLYEGLERSLVQVSDNQYHELSTTGRNMSGKKNTCIYENLK